MKYKIVIALKQDNTPLNAEVLIFIDDQYYESVYTINGHAEDIIEIGSTRISAFYSGDDDLDMSYMGKSLPPTPSEEPPVRMFGNGLSWVVD